MSKNDDFFALLLSFGQNIPQFFKKSNHSNKHIYLKSKYSKKKNRDDFRDE